MRKGLFVGLGLEDISEDLEGNEETLELSGGMDGAEEALLQVQEAGSEVQQSEQLSEELEDVAASMESMIVSIENAVYKGGLSLESARILAVTADHHSRRLGLSRPIRVGIEGFAQESDRVQSTRVALESYKDTLKQVWLAIKAAIAKAWEAVRNFVLKIISSLPKLAKRAEELKKLALTVKDQKPAATEVEGSFVAGLQVENEANAASFVKGLSQLVSLEENNKTSAGLLKYSKELVALLETVKTADDVSDAFGEALAKINESATADILKSMENSSDVTSEDRFAGYTRVVGSKAFPGNKAIYCLTKEADADKKVKGSVKVEVLAVAGDYKALEKAPTATSAEIITICDRISSLAAAAEANSKLVADAEVVNKQLAGVLNRLSGLKFADDEVGKVKAATFRTMQECGKVSGETAKRSASLSLSLTIAAARAGLQYSEASVRAYKEVPKKEDAKPADKAA